MKIKSQDILYYTMIILMFQITRNISTVGYVLVLYTSYCMLYLTALMESRRKIDFRIKTINLIFLCSVIWIPLISLKNTTINEFLISMPRYMITFPFIFFCGIYKKYDKKLIIRMLKAYCNFIALSSLSIPYQIVFGRIPFFAESSFRAGVIRYSSLAGSLTALGSLGAIAIMILLFSDDELYNRRAKLILVMIITASMLMTLQKAALANIIICFTLYFFSSRKQSLNVAKKIGLFMSIIIMISILYGFIKDTIIGLYIQKIFSYSFSGSSVGMKQDLISRFWFLPSKVVQANDIKITDFILGIGFRALSGTMGLIEYPMAHNNYFDLIFSGGIVHLLSYMILLLLIPFKVFKKKILRYKISNLERTYLMVIVVILINMLIGGSNFYQPVFASIVFVMIFSYDKVNDKK